MPSSNQCHTHTHTHTHTHGIVSQSRHALGSREGGRGETEETPQGESTSGNARSVQDDLPDPHVSLAPLHRHRVLHVPAPERVLVADQREMLPKPAVVLHVEQDLHGSVAELCKGHRESCSGARSPCDRVAEWGHSKHQAVARPTCEPLGCRTRPRETPRRPRRDLDHGMSQEGGIAQLSRTREGGLGRGQSAPWRVCWKGRRRKGHRIASHREGLPVP